LEQGVLYADPQLARQTNVRLVTQPRQLTT
jgi:hypothetical protein